MTLWGEYVYKRLKRSKGLLFKVILVFGMECHAVLQLTLFTKVVVGSLYILSTILTLDRFHSFNALFIVKRVEFQHLFIRFTYLRSAEIQSEHQDTKRKLLMDLTTTSGNTSNITRSRKPAVAWNYEI